MLMKPETGVITNTQEDRIVSTLATGGTEYNSILHISMHSGTHNFCHQVETARLEISEDQFKYIHQSSKEQGLPRGCSHKSKHDPRCSRCTVSSKVRRGMLWIFKELVRHHLEYEFKSRRHQNSGKKPVQMPRVQSAHLTRKKC